MSLYFVHVFYNRRKVAIGYNGAPLIAARGSEGALKLPQRVRAEPGRQTPSGAFSAYLDAFLASIFMQCLLGNFFFGGGTSPATAF